MHETLCAQIKHRPVHQCTLSRDSSQEVSCIAKRAAFLSTPSIYFSLSKARMQHALQASRHLQAA